MYVYKHDVLKNTEGVIDKYLSQLKEFISTESQNVIDEVKNYKLQLARDIKDSLLKHKTSIILNKYPAAKEYVMKLGVNSNDIDSAASMSDMGFSD